eukprot:PLAT3657.11.p1 GENE.PLAT3657.11~~PLAT3657.11.p1  ORF type:complete len:921 (-),score=319.77 PLAT3657.11:1371-3737(-)
MIERILQLPPPLRGYITCARDGTVRFWRAPGLQHIVTLCNRCRQPLPCRLAHGSELWVTDIELLPRYRLLAVASIEPEVVLYDLHRFNCVGVLNGLRCLPMRLHYCEDAQTKQCWLVLGDDVGGITVLELDPSGFHVCDGKLRSACHDERSVKGVRARWRMQLHERDISKLFYVKEHHRLVISSLDGTLSFVDLRRRKLCNRWRPGMSSVLSFFYCPSYEHIAACGTSSSISLWSLVSRRPVQTLAGHSSAVLEVAEIAGTDHLISLGVDKTIMMWDAGQGNCLQVIEDRCRYLPEDHISTMLFDDREQLLVTASDHLRVWPLRMKFDRDECSHTAPLVGVLLQADRRKVLSADSGAAIHVWDLDTGALLLRLPHAHGCEITAMTLCHDGRYLLTGAHDGSIHMFDMEIGECIRYFAGCDSEVSTLQVVCLPRRYVVAGCWDGKLYFFPVEDLREQRYSRVIPSKPDLQHSGDLLCSALLPPHTIVTGSSAGGILHWSCLTERRGMIAPDDGRLPEGADAEALLRAAREENCVNALLPLQRLQLLISCGSGPRLQVWDLKRFRLLGSFAGCHMKKETMLVLKCNAEETVLAAGDSAGHIRVYDVSNLTREQAESGIMHMGINQRAHWLAHDAAVVDLQLVPTADDGLLIISAGKDRQLQLWTAGGVRIGCFGQEEAWKLHERSTWAASEPATPMEIPSDSTVAAAAALVASKSLLKQKKRREGEKTEEEAGGVAARWLAELAARDHAPHAKKAALMSLKLPGVVDVPRLVKSFRHRSSRLIDRSGRVV